MRSVIFPCIHERWKSSRNKDGEREYVLANGDCTQCAHVGAAIPQLVTYVPFVAAVVPVLAALLFSPSLSYSTQLSTLPPPPTASTFASSLSFVWQTARRLFSPSEAFHSSDSSASTTRTTRTTKNMVSKDELTFDLCKTLTRTEMSYTKVEHDLQAFRYKRLNELYMVVFAWGKLHLYAVFNNARRAKFSETASAKFIPDKYIPSAHQFIARKLCRRIFYIGKK